MFDLHAPLLTGDVANIGAKAVEAVKLVMPAVYGSLVIAGCYVGFKIVIGLHREFFPKSPTVDHRVTHVSKHSSDKQ